MIALLPREISARLDSAEARASLAHSEMQTLRAVVERRFAELEERLNTVERKGKPRRQSKDG